MTLAGEFLYCRAPTDKFASIIEYWWDQASPIRVEAIIIAIT
jgi:hypothetical protein